MATEVVTGRWALSDGTTVTATTSLTIDTPTTGNPALGVSMSDYAGHGGVQWEAARVYRDKKADEAIRVYGSRIILYSDPTRPQTPSAVKADLTRIVNLAKASGIPNPEVHWTLDNEADREHTTSSAIAQFKIDFKALAPVVRSVPGCTMWMNLTRHNIGTGKNEPFVTPDMIPSIDGLAINCYSPGMDKVPTDYTTDVRSWMDPMFQWIAAKGVTRCSAWETGTDAENLTKQAEYAPKLAIAYRDGARAAGLTPVAIAWWDSVKPDGTRDSRMQGTTRDAWRAAFN